MTKKLYRVTLQYDMVVAAENEDKALLEAEFSATDEPISNKTIFLITNLDELPPGWDKECIPWGESDGKTIGEIL
jgi:hypothetical protein